MQDESSGMRNEQVHVDKGGEPWLQAGLEHRGRLSAAWGRDLAAVACNSVPVTLVTQKILSSWLLSKATHL